MMKLPAVLASTSPWLSCRIDAGSPPGAVATNSTLSEWESTTDWIA